MSSLYEQLTGNLYDPTDNLIGKGYAGRDVGKNNPLMQDIHGIGPLPVGSYTLGVPVEHSQLGPFAIPLIPDTTNEMFGRSGFYMHGDSIDHPGQASDGCIIMSRDVREAMHANADNRLIVVASKVNNG